MTKPYKVGLVVGKFAPLHNGHLLVMQRAASMCGEIIIISYSNPELPGYEAERREIWLKTCFPAAKVLVVTAKRLAAWLDQRNDPNIPANGGPDVSQREFVAMLCTRVLKSRIDAVFTSEDYGEGFAAHLTEHFRSSDPIARPVHHVLVDRERRAVAISSTNLRSNLWRYWEFLPQVVARTLVQRIAILGGESSGKTELAASMARDLGTVWAPEYGRELWEARRGNLQRGDMITIAREQIIREENAVEAARAFVFCDTSPLTTLFYSLEMFGQADPDLLIAAQRLYSTYVLCAADFPFVQDGTRRTAAFRVRQNEWYETKLAARNISYLTARGPISDRVEFVRRILNCDFPRP